jgi:hypothetical protein
MFLIKSVLYGEMNKVENQLVKFDSFVWFKMLLTVQNLFSLGLDGAV